MTQLWEREFSNVESLVVGSFNSSNICTFVMNQRPCWIGITVAELFGYENSTKAISRCIKKESLKIGTDYDVLTKIDLYKFKQILLKQGYDRFNKAPRLIILYEEGVKALADYTNKPIGNEFRKWIRECIIEKLETKELNIQEKKSVKVSTREKDILVEYSEMINEVCKCENIEKKEILKNLLEGFKVLLEETKLMR